MEVNMDISSFLYSVEQWAKRNDDIRALILVGSYARGEAREDSDVDLVIITTSPEAYINSRFIDSFGEVRESKKEDWGRVTSIRTWYADDNLEVEFGITTPIWVERPLDAGTFRALSDGYRVIVDKEDYFKDII
jgi:predicted nucleotidyltransferase